jgi:hypothetical protein
MTPAEAWSAVVEGEHAAVYAYSVAGAHLSGAAASRAVAGLAAHRANRDWATATIVAKHGTPPAGAIAYELPANVSTPAGARALLAEVDNRLVASYADAVAATTGGERRTAVRAAVDYAVRAVDWGADSQAFPAGQPTPSGD